MSSRVDDPAAIEPVRPAAGRRPAWLSHRTLQGRYPVLQVIALVILLGYGALFTPGFVSAFTLRTMLVLASLLGLVAFGQTLVVLLGGIDLSAPAYIVLGATLITELTSLHHWPALAVVTIIVVLSGILGAISGWICHRFTIHPLIVTLGMGSVVSGATIGWTNANITGAAPAVLGHLGLPFSDTFGLPIPPTVAIWAVVAVIAGIMLKRTIYGRWLYAAGLSPKAADLALVPTRRIWISVFALSAVMAALGGLLIVGFSGTADSTLGDPYLFEGIAAVILGGAAPLIGAVDYWRTVLGALIYTVLSTLLIGHGLSYAAQQVAFGILILLALGLYGREARIRDRV